MLPRTGGSHTVLANLLDIRQVLNPGALVVLLRESQGLGVAAPTGLGRQLLATCAEAEGCLPPPSSGGAGIGRLGLPRKGMLCVLPLPPLVCLLLLWPKATSSLTSPRCLLWCQTRHRGSQRPRRRWSF